MYDYLKGELTLADMNTAIIDCGGVGYKCFISLNTHKKISLHQNQVVKIFTHLNVREDALDLYGFESEQERALFTQLISISGVGPKIAMAILSDMLPEEFAAAIMTEDSKRLTKISGIGQKMAQRLCLELKDKIAKTSAEISNMPEFMSQNESVSDAVAVLIALGYSRYDAQKALERCSADNTNDLVKQALRFLSRV